MTELLPNPSAADPACQQAPISHIEELTGLTWDEAVVQADVMGTEHLMVRRLALELAGAPEGPEAAAAAAAPAEVRRGLQSLADIRLW